MLILQATNVIKRFCFVIQSMCHVTLKLATPNIVFQQTDVDSTSCVCWDTIMITLSADKN